MRKIRYGDHQHGKKQIACTVSAAALMLGVSQAATVAFNFQTHYCGAASYSGAIVTAPAFGVGTNGWENLAQMDTGYGCDPGYYTLTNNIDTTSSAEGLNPLPNGALTVVWSGYTANVSGFGGYTRPGPHYTFGGNGYLPGNEQVYWGFMRDGVNFGPGSTAGDNNQPGYSIDITGLKSLFTNSSFAVQLIASSDSMQYLTNAFIIDATGSTTQSVVYPSTPPIADAGGTTWLRGIGGGLSTTSGSLDTDHLKIIGNRAAHAGDKTTGFNFASTISGFIVTDKPVITMSPQPVVVAPGDTITWSGYACGASPLSYQWQKDGVPIAGATSTALSITNVTQAAFGNYSLVASNLYGTATSSSVTIDKLTAIGGNNFTLDSNPNALKHDGLVNGATWIATNSDGATSRTGVMSFNSTNSNQLIISGSTNFDSSTGTLMFWMRSPGLSDTNGKPATIFDRRNSNGMTLVQNADGSLELKTSQNAQDLIATANLADNKWHQIAVTYDQDPAGEVDLYVDGQPSISAGNAGAWSWQPGQELEFGLSHDTNSFQPFNGVLDDVRVYNRVLTATEVGTAFSAGGVIDGNALSVRLDFDAAPSAGVTLTWQASDAILQSADSPNGTFIDVPGAVSPLPTAQRSTAKFYRYRGHLPQNIVSNPFLM